MGVVLLTVVRGARRRDLAVPSDVPVAALMRPLLDALTTDPGDRGDERSQAWAVTNPGTGPPHSQGGEDPGSRPPDVPRSYGGEDPGSERPDHDVGLALAPVCGPALPRDRSLEASGVGHGAVLVLLDRPPAARSRAR
jgi:hypothetical protein